MIRRFSSVIGGSFSRISCATPTVIPSRIEDRHVGLHPQNKMPAFHWTIIPPLWFRVFEGDHLP
jgi:hypothetical protein